jgi:hypothetical protein
MNRSFALFCFAAGALGASAIVAGAEDAAPAAPSYTSDGRLVYPKDYREWVYVSSGLGMTYSAPGAGNADPLFTNVFVSPASYRAFTRTGHWPDRTVFVLEERASTDHGSIVKGGRFQRELRGLIAHVKDARLPDGWRFFAFDPPAATGSDGAAGRPIPASAGCMECHTKNGAVEHTFVQFYPTLLEIAKEKGTLNESYVRAEREAARAPE